MEGGREGRRQGEGGVYKEGKKGEEEEERERGREGGITVSTEKMKSTKVQTLGGIWCKYWNIWIENTFACIRIR